MPWKSPMCNAWFFTTSNANTLLQFLTENLQSKKEAQMEVKLKAEDDNKQLLEKCTRLEEMISWVAFISSYTMMKTIELRFENSLIVIHEES